MRFTVNADGVSVPVHTTIYRADWSGRKDGHEALNEKWSHPLPLHQAREREPHPRITTRPSSQGHRYSLHELPERPQWGGFQVEYDAICFLLSNQQE